MDLSEYVLIEGAARDRLLDLLPAVVPRRVNGGGSDVDARDGPPRGVRARVQPRAIDRVLHER